MIIKKILVQNLVDFLRDEIVSIYGTIRTDMYFDNIPDVDHVNSTSLDWINPSKNNQEIIAEKSKAKLLLVGETFKINKLGELPNKVIIKVKSPRMTLMHVIENFFIEKKKAFIDKTASIHPNAKIGENVYIGPNCSIGECEIGDNNIIHSNVSIYDRVIIGDDNEIHSGCVIGVPGLGCMRDCNGILHEFPHIGGVHIMNRTSIGANCHIACGALSDTIIENGCKINGMCFIGHNNHLHENVLITGSSMFAGSVVIEKNATIYSNVVIRDQRKVGESAVIGMGSIVTKDIPANEIWVGNPAKKFK